MSEETTKKEIKNILRKFLFKNGETDADEKVLFLPKTLIDCVYTSNGQSLADYLTALQLNNSGNDITIDDSISSHYTTYSSNKVDTMLKVLENSIKRNNTINGLTFKIREDNVLQIEYDDEIFKPVSS